MGHPEGVSLQAFHLDKDTRLLSMLNGIELGGPAGADPGGDVVCAAPTRISAVISSPGVISHKGTFANFRCGFLDKPGGCAARVTGGRKCAAKVEATYSTTIPQKSVGEVVFLVSSLVQFQYAQRNGSILANSGLRVRCSRASCVDSKPSA